jgi:hypothetical protein
MVALISEVAALQGGARVLEVGTGSGYQAAVLARLAREVYSIECLAGLQDRARVILNAMVGAFRIRPSASSKFCNEHGFAYWLAHATVCRGTAIAEQGRGQDALATIDQGLQPLAQPARR